MMAEPRVWTLADKRRLRADLLDLLPAPDQQPVSTNDLAARLDLNAHEAGYILWRQLDYLARHGWVGRIVRPEYACRWWRRTRMSDVEDVSAVTR